MSTKGIRLSEYDIKAIKVTFQNHFLKEDNLWLFGSRADLTKKGGDIDLYLETKIDDSKIAFDKKNKFLIDLKDLIGDQKIDVVLNLLKNNFKLPIYVKAKKVGIKII